MVKATIILVVSCGCLVVFDGIAGIELVLIVFDNLILDFVVAAGDEP